MSRRLAAVHAHDQGPHAQEDLTRWIPALAFGIVLLVVTRVVNRPLVIPAVIGLVLFAIGVVVTGSSIEELAEGLLRSDRSPRGAVGAVDRAGSLDGGRLVGGARPVAGIATAIFVALIACLFNMRHRADPAPTWTRTGSSATPGS